MTTTATMIHEEVLGRSYRILEGAHWLSRLRPRRGHFGRTVPQSHWLLRTETTSSYPQFSQALSRGVAHRNTLIHLIFLLRKHRLFDKRHTFNFSLYAIAYFLRVGTMVRLGPCYQRSRDSIMLVSLWSLSFSSAIVWCVWIMSGSIYGVLKTE